MLGLAVLDSVWEVGGWRFWQVRSSLTEDHGRWGCLLSGAEVAGRASDQAVHPEAYGPAARTGWSSLGGQAFFRGRECLAPRTGKAGEGRQVTLCGRTPVCRALGVFCRRGGGRAHSHGPAAIEALRGTGITPRRGGYEMEGLAPSNS